MTPRLRLLLLVAALVAVARGDLIGPPAEHACSFWDEPVGGYASDPDMYHPRGHVPNATDTVVFSKDGDYTVIVDQNLTVGGLRLAAYPGHEIRMSIGGAADGESGTTVTRLAISGGSRARRDNPCLLRAPHAPGEPQIDDDDVQDRSVVLTFRVPSDSGSGEVEQYRVEVTNLHPEDGNADHVGFVAPGFDPTNVNEAVNGGPEFSHFHPDVAASVVADGLNIQVKIAQLRPARLYNFRVSAANDQFYSDWSPASRTITTLTDVPDFIAWAQYGVSYVGTAPPTHPPSFLSGSNGVLIIEFPLPNINLLNGTVDEGLVADDGYQLTVFERYGVHQVNVSGVGLVAASLPSSDPCDTDDVFGDGTTGGPHIQQLREYMLTSETNSTRQVLQEGAIRGMALFRNDPAFDDLAYFGCFRQPSLLISGNSRVQILSGLTGTSIYHISVRAQNVNGWGPRSISSTGLSTNALPPSPPQALSITPEELTDAEIDMIDDVAVTIEWQRSRDSNGAAITYYYVQIRLGGGAEKLPCAPNDPEACAEHPYLECISETPESATYECARRLQSDGQSYELVVVGLPPGVTVEVQVRAYNAQGFSNAAVKALSAQSRRASPPPYVVGELINRCGGDDEGVCNFGPEQQKFAVSVGWPDPRGGSIVEFQISYQPGGRGPQPAPLAAGPGGQCVDCGAQRFGLPEMESDTSNGGPTHANMTLHSWSECGFDTGVVGCLLPYGLQAQTWYRFTAHAISRLHNDGRFATSDQAEWSPWVRSGSGMVRGTDFSVAPISTRARWFHIDFSPPASSGMAQEADPAYRRFVRVAPAGVLLLDEVRDRAPGAVEACPGATECFFPCGDVNADACTVKDLLPSTEYDVFVFTTNAAHRHPTYLWQAEVAMHTETTSDPGPPHAVSFGVTDTPVGGVALVTWEPDKDDFGYASFEYDWDVARTSDGLLVNSGRLAPEVSTPRLRLLGLQSSDTYTVTVRAVSPQHVGTAASLVIAPSGPVGMNYTAEMLPRNLARPIAGITTALLTWDVPLSTGGASYSDLCYHVWWQEYGADAADMDEPSKVMPFGADPADPESWCLRHDDARLLHGAGQGCPTRNGEGNGWSCRVSFRVTKLRPTTEYLFYIAISNGYEAAEGAAEALASRRVVVGEQELTKAGHAASIPRDLEIDAGAACARVSFTSPADDGGQSITAYCVLSPKSQPSQVSLVTRRLQLTNNFTCINDADAAEHFPGDVSNYKLLYAHPVNRPAATVLSSGLNRTASLFGTVVEFEVCGLEGDTTYDIAVVAWTGPLNTPATSRSSPPLMGNFRTSLATAPLAPLRLALIEGVRSPVSADEQVVIDGGSSTALVPLLAAPNDGGSPVHTLLINVASSPPQDLRVVKHEASGTWRLCTEGECTYGDQLSLATFPQVFVDPEWEAQQVPITGLPASSQTVVTVRALNSVESSASATTVIVRTVEASRPGCVRGMKLEAIDPTGNSPGYGGPAIGISWRAPLDNGGRSLTHYLVDADYGTGTFVRVGCYRANDERLTLNGDIVSLSLEQLRANVNHRVRVRAGNELSDGPILCAAYRGADEQAIAAAKDQCSVADLEDKCRIVGGKTASDDCWQAEQRSGVPGPPLPATVLQPDVRRRAIRLRWQAPQYDGGSPITNYTVLRYMSSGSSEPPIFEGWVAPNGNRPLSLPVEYKGDGSDTDIESETRYFFEIVTGTQGFATPVPTEKFEVQTAGPCSPGTTELAGAGLWEECQPCPQGTFQSESGQFECALCPQGRFTDQTGQAECQKCPLGHHQTARGATVCIPCAAGYFSGSLGAVQCSLCVSDEHGDPTFAFSGAVECDRCPTGAICDAGVLKIPQGTYWKRSNDYNESEVTIHTEFYECPELSRCRAVLPGRAEDAAISVKTAEEARKVQQHCEDNSQGVLCAVCAANYASVGTECVECPDGVANVLILLVVLIGVGVGASIWIRRQLTEPSKTSAVVRLMLNWLQMLSLLGTFKITGPRFIRDLMTSSAAVSDGFSMDSLIVKCATRMEFEDRFWMTMLLPLFAVIMPVIVIGMWALCSTQQGRRARELSANSSFRRSSRSEATRYYYLVGAAMTVLLVVVHKPVSTSIMRVFDCDDREILGESYLRSDFSVKCDSTHAALQSIAAVFFVGYVMGIPVAGVWWLRRNRSSLREPVFERHFQFLYAGYRLYAWEVVVVLRKVAVAAIAIFVTDSFQQVYVGSCFIVAFLILHLVAHPYEDPRLNNVETMSLTSSYVTQMGSILYWSRTEEELQSPEDDTDGVGMLVTLVLTVVNLATFLMFIFAAIYIRRAEKTEAAITSRKELEMAARGKGMFANPMHSPASASDVVTRSPLHRLPAGRGADGNGSAAGAGAVHGKHERVVSPLASVGSTI